MYIVGAFVCSVSNAQYIARVVVEAEGERARSERDEVCRNKTLVSAKHNGCM